MRITNCTAQIKPYARHQLMITKLQTFKRIHQARDAALRLKILKSVMKRQKWFIGRVRIPKFDYVLEGKKLITNSEFMYGKQFWPDNAKTLKDVIHDDLVQWSYIDRLHGDILNQKILPMEYGFIDFNLENFVIRNRDLIGKGEKNWEFAFVDLEAFGECSLEERTDKWIKQYVENT